MQLSEILKKVDHTLLSPTATENDIYTLCDEALYYSVASVCIPPCHVERAANYLHGRLPVCTVIGFPEGYNTTKTKLFEAQNAIKNGATELDMVVNIGDIKCAHFERVFDEIKCLREETSGLILKVIIETCLLTTEEKIKMCEIVSLAGADFIKTSTGFSSGGATLDDIILLYKYCTPNLLIKAAGGIKTIEDAEKFIVNGAARLGTSKIVKAAKNAGYII